MNLALSSSCDSGFEYKSSVSDAAQHSHEGCQTLVKRLVENKHIDEIKLKYLKSRLDQHYYKKFERRSGIRKIFITERSVVDNEKWIFSVYLWIFLPGYVIPNRQIRTFRTKFNISIKHLFAIENAILQHWKFSDIMKGKQNKNDAQYFWYFPNSEYPKIFDNSKELPSIYDSKRRENECFARIPLKKFWSYRLGAKCDNKTLITISNYLNSVFSSISLLEEEWFWKLFCQNVEIDNNIILLIKNLVKMEYASLLYESRHIKGIHPTIHQLMSMNESKTSEFHTLFVVSRPLNRLRNKKKKNLEFGFLNHWALKFEGNNHLLTIEFFAHEDENSNSIINTNSSSNSNESKQENDDDEYDENDGFAMGNIETTLYRNGENCSNQRRIFWYDETNFTQCWNVIEKINLVNDKNGKGLTLAELATIVNEWRVCENGKYALYHSVNNNCQHFVRDIVSCFNLRKAMTLNTLMEHKVE